MQRFFWLVLATCFAGLGRAQETGLSPDSTERLEEMTARANLLRAKFADDDARPLELVPQPVLRYSDAARRDTDGTMWVFAERERPVALVCLFIKPDRFREWNYEFVSLVDETLKVSGRPRWSWTPRKQSRTWTKLKDKVTGRAAGRTQQMRAIARQMQASEILDKEPYQLRLLNQPVYRYSDESLAIEDGAIFVYAYGTNPEVLMQIEARHGPGDGASWFVSFARLTAAAATVERAGETLWNVDPVPLPTAPGVGGFQPTDPYYSWFGPDPLDRSFSGTH